MTIGMRRRVAAALAALAAVPAVPVGGGLAYLKFNETDLVFRAGESRRWAGGFTEAPPAGVREVRIPLPDAAPLHGFTLTPAPSADTGYWVLHLHGNADSAFSAGQLANVQRLAAQGLAVLAFDYRGFGPSPGTPSEAGLYEDAEAAWRWLISQGVPPERIIIWGHSLGSGPATYLATVHRAAALVLFGAYTSITDRGAELYPWLPVSWVSSIRFDSLRRIPDVKAPVLVAHGLTDGVIPLSHGERLFAAAPEPRRLLRLAAIRDDGFGGHVTALYDQMELLMPVLRELTGMPE